MTKESRLEQDRRIFLTKLALLKDEAGRLGLWHTMQMLDVPVGMSGYEVAGTPEEYFKSRRELAKVVKRIQRGQNA